MRVLGKRLSVMASCISAVILFALPATSFAQDEFNLNTDEVIEGKSPTFGFDVKVPGRTAEQKQQVYNETLNKMMAKADKNLEIKRAQNELERQETLLYIAKQKLNGKTPLYGDEKADLEKIVKDAQVKVSELRKKHADLKSKYSDEELLADNRAEYQPQGFFDYSEDNEVRSNSQTRIIDDSGKSMQSQVHRRSVEAVDGLINSMQKEGFFERGVEEEEEEESIAVESAQNLMSPEDLLNSKEGLLVPNQPLNLPVEQRMQIREIVKKSLASSNMRLKSYERDMLNALLFNYGVQVLDDGQVIILETYLPQDQSRPMLAPGVPMPEGARQIVRAPVQATEPANNQAVLIPETEFNSVQNVN